MRMLITAWATVFYLTKPVLEIVTHPILLLMASGALLMHMFYKFW